jgi:hypothetical protein
MCANDLEGIVAKRLADPYDTRVSWLKIKNQAYKENEGRSDLFNGPRDSTARRRPRRWEKAAQREMVTVYGTTWGSASATDRNAKQGHLTSSRGRIESHKAIQRPFPLFRRFRPFGQASARRA